MTLLQFYELARKEIGALIVADEHPNIVRCFAMEEDTEFVYLALERCKQSLNDVLGSGNPQEGWSFVGPDGMPTALCMRVSCPSTIQKVCYRVCCKAQNTVFGDVPFVWRSMISACYSNGHKEGIRVSCLAFPEL